jgi:hypothetical protein
VTGVQWGCQRIPAQAGLNIVDDAGGGLAQALTPQDPTRPIGKSPRAPRQSVDELGRTCTCVVAAVTASAQTAPAAGTDIYHVHFAKSAPGQAVAHAKSLMTPDSFLAMPSHFVVLRHQEGDDWDFAVMGWCPDVAAFAARSRVAM